MTKITTSGVKPPIKLPWSYATYYRLAIGLLILQGMLNLWVWVRYPTVQIPSLTIFMFSVVFILPTGIIFYTLSRLQNGKTALWMEWTWALVANRGTQQERIHISLLLLLFPIHLLFGTAQILCLLQIEFMIQSWITFFSFSFIFITWAVFTYYRLKTPEY